MVKWEDYVRTSEHVLNSPQVRSSLEIITLIKKVNPTRLTLSESDRERGYQLKNKLQSLLLEHYGDSFKLIPHPAIPNIILIKHRALPSIDACHADLAALSSEALERVETAAPLYPERIEPKQTHEAAPRGGEPVSTPKQILKKAQTLLEEYDYVAAEEVLATLCTRDASDLPDLARAARILLHEIGAFERCIQILLCQPKNVLKNRGIRELLAVAYYHNGDLAEARAILDQLHPAEMGLETLFAYANIAFKDGNLFAAFELANLAEGKEGFSSDLESLKKEIESVMSEQAEPVVQKAQAAFRSAAIEEARRLAREALDLHPNCQKARTILSAIDAIDEEAQLAELWAKVEKEPGGERRLALLAALRERDKLRKDLVKKLISEEKARQRRVVFDEHVESLRSLVHQERWPECFDSVSFLMRQPEFRERADEILSLSPFFPILHENKRLEYTADRSAKELWLRFIKTKSALAAGDNEGCLEALEELKPWFGFCPEFRADYLEHLRREQEKARKEIGALLAKSEATESAADEVRQIQACIKKKMSVLPIDERRELARALEEKLDRLIPEKDSSQILEQYREALQLGCREKAAHLRQEITDSAAREALEAEFAETFSIAFEPVTLEFSDDLPVDLTTPPPLHICYAAGHRLFLEDNGPETMVMIDFAAKAACRISSPVFAISEIFDYNQQDSFLFVEQKGEDVCGDRAWRAELSVERAAFRGSFSMREMFEAEDGFSVRSVYFSNERDTDYYVVMQHEKGLCPPKVLKKRLSPKATVETFEPGKCTDLKMWRWTCYPEDRFIIGSKGKMRHVNRNLSLRGGVSLTPDLYHLDGNNGYLYGVEDCMLTKRGSGLQIIKCFKSAVSFSLFEPGRVHGLSFQTDTALTVLGDDRQSFYHLANNTFSQKVRVGRVIPSRIDGKWYCFDYNREQGKLWLRDITRVIHTKLEWREFFSIKAKRTIREKRLLWFNGHDNFVYRPEEWEDTGAPASW